MGGNEYEEATDEAELTKLGGEVDACELGDSEAPIEFAGAPKCSTTTCCSLA